MSTPSLPLQQRLAFDLAQGELRDADRRYVLMRPDVLMGMFARLGEADRTRALTAMAASAHANGGKSIRAYRDDAAATSAQLLAIVSDSAAALGWGRWQFDTPAGTLALEVANNPFAAGFGASDTPVCAPINGLLQSVAEAVLGAPAEVRETACAAQHGHATCRFTARRVAAAPEAAT